MFDNPEMKKLLEECNRLQTEMSKLADDNRQLKDDGIRMRKMTSNSTASLPYLLVVIAAIFIGFFLGKFIL